jgi:hypothetical protein
MHDSAWKEVYALYDLADHYDLKALVKAISKAATVLGAEIVD